MPAYPKSSYILALQLDERSVQIRTGGKGGKVAFWGCMHSKHDKRLAGCLLNIQGGGFALLAGCLINIQGGGLPFWRVASSLSYVTLKVGS